MKLQSFVCTVFAVALFALGTSAVSAQSTSRISKNGRVHENWYMYWGLGYSFLQYPDDIQATLDQINDLPGVGHFSLAIDALGFYWPVLNNSTVLGVVMNGVNDNYSTDVDNSFSVFQGMISASFMHSLTDIIGDGITVRVDAGLATLNSEYRYGTGNTTTTTRSDTEVGFGFLVGAGYALPVSSETSLLFNGNYAMRLVDGDSFGAVTLGLGVFF